MLAIFRYAFTYLTMQNDGKTIRRGVPNAKKFSSEYQPEKNGRPKGSLSLDTRVRRLLEGEEDLPPAIKKTILNAVGADKNALDAIIIVGMLQALQGDHNWGKMIKEWGFGKEIEKTEISGPNGTAFTVEVKFGK